MKMLKGVLLGSAAGVVAVAGAQAADLPVKAKPVEYVKICTLYGDGFYYIPGSDTCIRFSGYIRADYNWNGRRPHVLAPNGAQDRTIQRSTMRHRARFQADTRTQTGYGTLRTFMSVNFDNDTGSDEVNASRAFIQWGGFTFGRTASFTDQEGDLGDGGMRSLHSGLLDSSTSSNGINQIAYTWQLGNGITFNIGADDARARSIANLTATATTIGSDPTSSAHGQSHPDPWVALRVNQAWGSASLAFVGHKNAARYYTAGGGVGVCAQPNTTLCNYPDDKWGWAVLSGIEIKLDMLSPGSRVGMFGAYGQGASRITINGQTSVNLFGSGNTAAFGVRTDAAYVNGSNLELTTTWAVGGGFEYFWTRNFSSTIYGGYSGTEYNNNVVSGRWFCSGGGLPSTITVAAGVACDPSYNLWQIGTHHDWFPVPGLRFAVDVLYTNIDTAFDGQTVTLGKTQGARPTGAYLIKDRGILSIAFRAQRTWGGRDD
jgi:hypothetical protein